MKTNLHVLKQKEYKHPVRISQLSIKGTFVAIFLEGRWVVLYAVHLLNNYERDANANISHIVIAEKSAKIDAEVMLLVVDC